MLAWQNPQTQNPQTQNPIRLSNHEHRGERLSSGERHFVCPYVALPRSSHQSQTPMNRLAPTISYASPDDPAVKSALIRGIERLTGRRRLERLYQGTRDAPDDAFWSVALDQLEVSLDYDAAQLQTIPSRGPVVFVANHPFGVLDGLAFCHLVSSVRPDFKILINSVLCRDERLDAYFLPVNFQDTDAARATNFRTIKTALRMLASDGAIAMFPAGGIATAPKVVGDARDLEWKPFVAKLVQASEATVVPLYFHGQNSLLFQLVSKVSLTLRLSLIIREVMRKTGETMAVSIGESISYERLSHFDSRDALTAYLRDVTFALGDGE